MSHWIDKKGWPLVDMHPRQLLRFWHLWRRFGSTGSAENLVWKRFCWKMQFPRISANKGEKFFDGCMTIYTIANSTVQVDRFERINIQNHNCDTIAKALTASYTANESSLIWKHTVSLDEYNKLTNFYIVVNEQNRNLGVVNFQLLPFHLNDKCS